jgi:FkbM family methyltransferase
MIRRILQGYLRQFRMSLRPYPQLLLVMMIYIMLRVLNRCALRRWKIDFSKFVTMKLVGRVPVDVSYYGFRIRLLLGEFPLYVGAFRDTVELMEKNLLLEKLKPRTAIDVGAHMGSYSLILFKTCEKVVALEPQESVKRVLLRNLRLNRVNNVYVLPFAASSMSGISAEIVGAGDLAKVLLGKGPVTTITIDDVVRQFFPDKGPDFIKIDGEGHELEVLKGALKTLKERKPLLLVEVWEHNDNNVRRLLEKARYRVIEGHGLTKHSAGIKNVLAVPGNCNVVELL